MFFLLSKILDFLISPLTWILVCLLWALFSKKPGLKKKLLMVSAAMLLFFTNPFIFNMVMLGWEPPVTQPETLKQYEAGIMLGGAIRYFNSTAQRPAFGQGVDRFMQILDLYQKRKIQRIIISSGSGSLVYTDIKEADLLRNLLISFTIDSTHVFAESQSRNTHENAVCTAQLLKANNFKGPFVLVTSAFHMRRAVLCFKKQGVDVIPFPVDQHAGKNTLTPDRLIIPNTEILQYWNLLFHEWVGMATYKMAGYI